MSYQILTGFPRGLDLRKSAVTSPVGSLVELVNGFINNGQEIEKRLAFVKTALPENTFGLQATNEGLLTFGSIATPVEFPVTASGFTVNYRQLAHPDGSTAMSAVLCSCAFKGNAFVIAEFADGKIFPYYDGTLIRDFTDGVALAHLNTTTLLADALESMIDAQGDYTANNVGTVTTITALEDKDFELSASADTAGSGDITVARANYAVSGKPATAAVGQFEIYAGEEGYHASLAISRPAPTILIPDGSQITIDGRTYTFKTTLTPANNEVLIDSTGATDTEKNSRTLTNLAYAINRTAAYDEVKYFVTSAHATVDATAPVFPAVTMTVTAKLAGIAGNNITVTGGPELAPLLSTAMTGGGDFGIFRVVVNGVDLITLYSTNLTAYPSYANGQTDARWLVNNEYCAAQVAAAINANYLTSGYHAENYGAVVHLLANDPGAATNGYVVEVWALGKVCVGRCALQFTGKQFTVNKLFIDGVESLQTASAFDVTNGDVLSDFVASLDDKINTGPASGLYISVAIGETLYISKFITKSDDEPVDVQVDITSVDGGAVAFLNENETTPEFAAFIPQTIDLPLAKPFKTDLVTCLAGGGAEPYDFRWERTSGSKRISFTSKKKDVTAFSCGKRTPVGESARFVCVVKAADGKTATTNEIIVTTVEA